MLKQTGMRPVEARNMRWRDIEFENVGRISKRQRDLDLESYRHKVLKSGS